MPNIPRHTILFAMMGGLVVGCAQADQPEAGGKPQMTKQHTDNPNALNKAGDPVIFDAIEKMDLARVKHLVEAGADIEKQGFGEQTPALVAASAMQWDICLYLLNQGADATIADDVGITIPYLAFNSRILPASYQGQYLAKVQEFLVQRKLDALNLPPKRVKELKATGAWPPKVMPAK